MQTGILNKHGNPDPEEVAVMRTHAAGGHAMLDGSGYPDGLRGADIPDLVRRVTIRDIYGALIVR